MAEQPESESIPYELLIPEMEQALHRATSENVILRARLAARDRELAALRAAAASAPPPPAPTMEQTFEEGGS